jgi:hypothetical protein
MTVLAKLLGITEEEQGRKVLLRTRDGWEKQAVVFTNDFALKVIFPVSELSLQAGYRSQVDSIHYTARRFQPSGKKENELEIWEE